MKPVVTERKWRAPHQSARHVARAFDLFDERLGNFYFIELAVDRLAVFKNDLAGDRQLRRSDRETQFDFQRLALPRDCYRLDGALPQLLMPLSQRARNVGHRRDGSAERFENAQDRLGRRGARLAEAVVIDGLKIVKTGERLQ